MNATSNIVALRQPDDIDDPLTNILRAGARQLLAQAVEIEVETFLATVKDLNLHRQNPQRCQPRRSARPAGGGQRLALSAPFVRARGLMPGFIGGSA